MKRADVNRTGESLHNRNPAPVIHSTEYRRGLAAFRSGGPEANPYPRSDAGKRYRWYRGYHAGRYRVVGW